MAGLVEMCAGLRSCAIVGPGGDVLAESAPNGWSVQVPELWNAADDAPGRPRATQIHVASEAGEVFAARAGGLTAIAITDRFALASLMFCDLREVLREIPSGRESS